MTENNLEICTTVYNLYKSYAHCNDSRDLKRHLIQIQQDLLEKGEINYRCIERFKFAYPRIKDRFFYEKILKLGQALKNEKPYFLDIGCCTGTDLRQLFIDGYPKECLIGLEMQQCYIDCGYSLFRDNTHTCPIRFLTENLFDIDDQHPLYKKVKIIHAGSVFHLFNSSEDIEKCIYQTTELLQPGGLLVGGHVCADRSVRYYRQSTNSVKYLSGIDDFKQLLSKQRFTDIQIETHPRLGEEENEQSDFTAFFVSFSAVYNPHSLLKK
ncbi:hypothetical protein BDF20DRAFT_860313 [Mycotypha africana]|uniref:uncharacterized protein n=1 Tax=Mycotypha africana TaxID=64632 RepID=UPI0023001B32|nr:uncharacterized protein BDF20DRAFT_860313 [Mycotypha africana]KAI8984501.1 hypothetical protein BDF20DRAFT_860313 [Mycotypha africana]